MWSITAKRRNAGSPVNDVRIMQRAKANTPGFTTEEGLPLAVPYTKACSVAQRDSSQWPAHRPAEFHKCTYLHRSGLVAKWRQMLQARFPASQRFRVVSCEICCRRPPFAYFLSRLPALSPSGSGSGLRWPLLGCCSLRAIPSVKPSMGPPSLPLISCSLEASLGLPFGDGAANAGSLKGWKSVEPCGSQRLGRRRWISLSKGSTKLGGLSSTAGRSDICTLLWCLVQKEPKLCLWRLASRSSKARPSSSQVM